MQMIPGGNTQGTVEWGGGRRLAGQQVPRAGGEGLGAKPWMSHPCTRGSLLTPSLGSQLSPQRWLSTGKALAISESLDIPDFRLPWLQEVTVATGREDMAASLSPQRNTLPPRHMGVLDP